MTTFLLSIIDTYMHNMFQT